MNLLKITNPNRQWYEVVLWWEVRRIPYNIIMYFIGYLSFYIGYVTLPLLYLATGLILNFVYTFGWVMELLVMKKLSERAKLKYPKYAFGYYLIFSIALVLGISFFIAS